MADIVGRGDADGEQIGRRSFAKVHLVADAGGQRDDRAVEIGRSAEGRTIPRGTGEGPVADRAAIGLDGAPARFADAGDRGRGTAAGDLLGHHPVDAVHRRRRGHPGAGDEGPAVPPPAGVRIVAAHHDRGAILAGDGNGAGAGIGAPHEIAQRRNAQVPVGDGIMIGCAARCRLVLGAIDFLVVARRALIDPFVRNNPGPGGPVAGEDGGVAGAGLGRRVALETHGEDDASAEAGEPAGEILAIFVVEIGRELIDRDDDEELRRCGRLRCRPRLRGCKGGHKSGSGQRREDLELHPIPFHDVDRSLPRPRDVSRSAQSRSPKRGPIKVVNA